MARAAGLRALEVLGYLAAMAVGLAGVVIAHDMRWIVKAAGPLMTIGLVLCVVVVVRFLAVIANAQLERRPTEPTPTPSPQPPDTEAREEVTR